MSASPIQLAPARADRDEVLALSLVCVSLRNASRTADSLELSPSQNPVPAAEFAAADRAAALRWLLSRRHVEHLVPAKKGDAGVPLLWRRIDGVTPRADSAFALTDDGLRFVDVFWAGLHSPDDERFEAAWAMARCGDLKPYYRQTERIFGWGQYVLKRFRQPATNQVLVLCAAEELGWPDWFDDPLPLTRGINPKKRLHDTIKKLNRHKPHLIQFKGDGTGRRVGWEYR